MSRYEYSESANDQSVTLTTASTEYYLDIPANAKGFEFQCRTAYDIRFAFVTGKVATPTDPYTTLKSGYTYSKDRLFFMAARRIYFASAQAGVVVELKTWI